MKNMEVDKEEIFSYSKISAFHNCPRAYFYRYIEKRPEEFKTIESHMGSVVHETLRWCYLETGQNRKALLPDIEKYYLCKWTETDTDPLMVVREDRSVGDYRDQGLSLLTAHYHRVLKHDESESLALEKPFTLEIGEKIFFTGVIDRISMSPEGRFRITDFKTGRCGMPLDTLQLPAYSMFFFNEFKQDGVELCFEDLRNQETRTEPVTRSISIETGKKIIRSVSVIREAVSFPVNYSPLCRWCGYREICRPGEFEKEKKKESTDGELTAGKGLCPECGGELVERKGKFGVFWGCKNYPHCTCTLDSGNSGRQVGKDTPAREICPECGSLLRQRKGRFGSFIGCSGYPGCRYTREKW